MDGVSCNTFRKAHDYYGRLEAFMTMITTQDEKLFCQCYRYITDFNKPRRSVGHSVWNLMHNINEIQRRQYANRKARQKVNQGGNK